MIPWTHRKKCLAVHVICHHHDVCVCSVTVCVSLCMCVCHYVCLIEQSISKRDKSPGFCPLWFCACFVTELVLKWEKTVQSDEREYEKVKNEENRHMNVSESSFSNSSSISSCTSFFEITLSFRYHSKKNCFMKRLKFFYVQVCTVFTKWTKTQNQEQNTMYSWSII